MLYEGKNPVRELLQSDKTIEKIMLQDKTTDSDLRAILSEARSKKIRVEFAPKEALDRLSKTGHHQGIIAVATDFKYTELEEVLNEDKKVFLLLDKLNDPHNLGSILRTAECTGVTAVMIPARGSVLVNETVIRSSAGAISHVRVVKVNNLHDAIKKIKDSGVFVYVTDMDGKSMYDVDLTGNVAIVVGSEGYGVSALTRKMADEVISIPMVGKINSLNASVSAGVVMYEVLRQGNNFGKR